ncbi:type II secretion system protein GspG [Gemmata sp. JC717]|uniref:Type II secretion system protein GspG n=1 Tax=Gemmata algarum TaxID=2975278 RepID=A0ABU5F4D1_9BACT|nr:type II secretion system protein GspG [Gemmata algarum]MDY3552021.1 type II secretion system protein GspG [Gemmata algarum]MDY3561672.1 type II secretion system protein GspG [Gemmata algarum]
MLLTTAARKSGRRAAFTLLEVLVVVAIIVILASVATVATTRYLEDAKKTKAQLACKAIVQAIDSYKLNQANTMQEAPSDLSQLLNPPFGGTGFLKNGQEDLMDPWGQQYQFKEIQQGDGSSTTLVFTHAKDGTNTPISQYGTGQASRVSQ